MMTQSRTKINAFKDWLETRWVSPSYGGLVLAGITLCFFGAATNTMAGWLYAISGIIFALLVLGAVLPARSLSSIEVRRASIPPISAGDRLTVALEIENLTQKPKTLLQVLDLLPYVVGPPVQTAIETLPPQSIHRWVYYPEVKRRGVYYWHEVQLKTAAPLGLFWCCRPRQVKAKAVVYPQVLPLARCPLVDAIGREESVQAPSDRRYQAANEGVTRTLRPYRQGDPTRLIHWRSSARLGEFQVRELEVVTSTRQIIIGLDTAASWQFENFEQAVIAAASLYFYASRSQSQVQLWTASTGLIQGNRVVLEALAATQTEEVLMAGDFPDAPVIWLTQNPNSLKGLPPSSRWLLFGGGAIAPTQFSSSLRGFAIELEKSLANQLQQAIR